MKRECRLIQFVRRDVHFLHRFNNDIILTTWHVTWSFCKNLVNRRMRGEFSCYWSINERFLYKFTLSTLLRLEWFPGFISFIEDINDHRSNFEKRTFHPIKFFREKKDGPSKHGRMKIIDLHLKRIFAGCYR